MKKLIITSIVASLPMLASTGIHAAPISLIAEDGSRLSEFCVAAAKSEGSLFHLARQMGIETLELGYIACNGEPLMNFVRNHRKIMHDVSDANYSFSHGDKSMETELCIAAVTAPEKFAALKPEVLTKNGNTINKVLCNSQPLESFVKRYGNPELSAL